MTEKRLLEFGTLTPETLNSLIARSDKDRRDLTIDRRVSTDRRADGMMDGLDLGGLTPEKLNALIARSGKERRDLKVDRRGATERRNDGVDGLPG